MLTFEKTLLEMNEDDDVVMSLYHCCEWSSRKQHVLNSALFLCVFV